MSIASHLPANFGSRRTLLRLIQAGLGLCLAGLTAVGQSDASKEYQIKAAFLYNFTKFVEWPDRCFPDTETPIVIAVLGRSPFGNDLAATVQGRHASGREIVIRSADSAEQARKAHILFVPAGEEGRFASFAPALQGAAVTTVGESDRFTAHGGMITFVQDAGRIRFAINLESADREQLKLSAQLLRLATEVRRKR